jgi:hypothetical protein
MTTEIPEQSLRQFRLNKINEISNVLDECDKTIEDLSERLEWDKKQLLAEVFNIFLWTVPVLTSSNKSPPGLKWIVILDEYQITADYQ